MGMTLPWPCDGHGERVHSAGGEWRSQDFGGSASPGFHPWRACMGRVSQRPHASPLALGWWRAMVALMVMACPNGEGRWCLPVVVRQLGWWCGGRLGP
jgi:hypothetical protein